MTVHTSQIPALIAELRDAAGDGTDWTEDLFQRASDALSHLTLDEHTPVSVSAPHSDAPTQADRDRVRALLAIRQINDVLSRINDPQIARRTTPIEYVSALQVARTSLEQLTR